MSSSESKRWTPMINQGLSIPELIKLVKHSFLECEFNEVQNILMNREKMMKMEIENLMRDHDSIKEEARLLERTQGLAELEKLKLKEKLQRCQRKCEELKETIAKLTEEQRAYPGRPKREEDCYDKVYEENVKMANEKNKLIFELNEKINELKNKNLESERLVGVYKEKLNSVDTRLVEMGQEIEDLRHEKLVANQTVEDLRQKQFETDQVVEELRRQNLEATQTVDELRLKKMNSDKTDEPYKRRFWKLKPRVMKMEATLANMLKKKAEKLANIVDTTEKSVAAEGENVDLPDSFKGGKDSLGNDNINADAEDVVVMSPGVHFASNSTGTGGIGLPKKGRRHSVRSWTKEDGTNTVQTSPGLQSTAQDNDSEEPRVSGSHAGVMCSGGGVPTREMYMFGEWCSNKIACLSSSAREVIEICDSDDETNAADTTYISDTSSGQTNKRNRTHCRGDSPVNLITKRKRSILISNKEENVPVKEKENQVLESTHDRNASLHNDVSVDPILDTGLPQSTLRSLPTREERTGPACDSQTLLQKFNANNDVDSTDSECSDAHMDYLVASCKHPKLKTQ